VKMKKLNSLILLLLIFSLTSAQEIIENPEKPLSNKAGRILELKEEVKISDENGDFFFRFPYDASMNEEGYIFISDYMGSNIYDFNKRKIIITDQEGDLISENSDEIETYNDFYGIYKNWFVLKKWIVPQGPERKTSKLYQDKHTVVLLSKDGITKRDSYTFPNERFWIAISQGGGFSIWDPFDAVLDENLGYLYVSSSREYLIHVLDLNRGIVVRNFRRKYKRVKYEMRQSEIEFMKKHNNPKKKYKEDIKTLYMNQNLLWVETSTVDDDKGIMIDVFNQEGEFIDNFFLNLNGDLISVHNNYIFVRETDEDENWVVKKYKIVG